MSDDLKRDPCAEERLQADERARKREYWSRRTGIPIRLMEIEWDLALIPAPVKAWAAGFPESAMRCGGIFDGPPGTGKSATGAWLIRALLTEDRAARVKMIAACDLFSLVFRRDHSRLANLRDVDLLVIDDWGMAYESEWPLAEMDGLVEHRYQHHRATIVTTNMHARRRPGRESFEDRYPRAFSRLCDTEGLGVVTFLREQFGDEQDLRLRGRR